VAGSCTWSFASRDEALAAEQATITDEFPKYNRRDNEHAVPFLMRRTLATPYPPTSCKLRRLGLTPDELYVPGTNIGRITPEADRAWIARMAELTPAQDRRRGKDRARHQKARPWER
jgi:hypothetical protein